MIRYEDDLIVNGINITPYLISCTISYNKLWGSDTGRTLSGNFSGTLTGIYPKIECTFRKLTQNEIQILASLLDSATQQVTYYDPYKQQKITMETYTGDYSIQQSNIFNKVDTAGKGMKVSFIAVRKRA